MTRLCHSLACSLNAKHITPKILFILLNLGTTSLKQMNEAWRQQGNFDFDEVSCGNFCIPLCTFCQTYFRSSLLYFSSGGYLLIRKSYLPLVVMPFFMPVSPVCYDFIYLNEYSLSSQGI